MIELNREQWHFLALLQAFGAPVPIEVIGTLAPLLPGPLMDLLEKAEAAGWLQRPAKGQFAIGRLPRPAREKLAALNQPEQLEKVIDTLYRKNLDAQLSSEAMLNLLESAGRCQALAEKEIKIAHAAVAANDLEKGRQFLERAVKRLTECRGEEDPDPLFIASVLELSNLYFSLGYGFQHVYHYLLKAQKIAAKLGNRRSHALVNLHLGRVFYFTGRRDDALVAFSLGYEEIKELDDEDILGQSAAFLGMFYFTKGQLKEAIKHFEKAEQFLEKEGMTILTTPTAPIFLGYCAVYLGQFHRAIGSLDYYWRLAEEQGNQALSSTIRAILGTVLVLLRKDREAAIHFSEARKESSDNRFSFGPYLAGGGIALMHFLNGRLEQAYKILRQTIEQGSHIGLVRQYSSPWILEMIYEFHRLGFEPLPGFAFPEILDRALNGVSIHLRGVAWRITAQIKMSQGQDKKAILADLRKSEQYLEESGDKVQLAKSIFVMVKLELQHGNRKIARELVHQARRLLGGYADELFPGEFKSLMDKEDEQLDRELRQQGFLRDYLEMFESLYPSDDRHEILAKMLNSTSCMFGAERSGLFWFHGGRSKAPELEAAYNLSRKETEVESFRESLSMVFKARQSNQPQIGRLRSAVGVRVGKHPIRSVLCIPIEINNTVQAVLYYDNSYLDDAFDFLDPETMKQMMRHTNLIVERHLHYLKLRAERNQLATEKSLNLEKETKIISRSGKMTSLLRQVDQVATTDSTILITGETGTGKELLASRIHHHSSRERGPFIVVDSTTIPENLLESELFGHEKGAFTGADQKKIGRIELAHQGTLFMDEIGELPLAAQAKLLRALQTRKFNRVGGTQPITADFRLIAATNRNLVQEVESGRFREDLYFRLNVIPIHLPPLRERREDIPLLAEYYLNLYARKYQRRGLFMTADQKKKLQEYRWPGNVRELQNIIERAVLLSDDNQLEIRLPAEIQISADNPFADLPTMEEMQRRYIKYVLAHCGGKIGGPGGAAEVLGLKRTSLYSRMKILGMEIKK
ncbi:MAG: sigma 54-interacting transcriptional regulator [Deltaproteobacteria bacterium]|nr:sigma 54-interacting transcriptional regulator [Deltaproteobacteria bacterium]